MIATILPSSTNFHAVEYNEKKVNKGKAELLEMSNFGYLEGSDAINATTLRDYLVNYSKQNENIKKAQFHVAFSCKGNEYTPQQLVDIAHLWLKEMGYGEEGQPLLIYAHHDTDNTHIHVVTSRIAPDGHKIDHCNERRRSQAILNRIMGVDRKLETKDVIKSAFSYSFATLGQFQAILESSGYECYKNEENINVKIDGMVIDHILIADVEKRFQKFDKIGSERRRKQLNAILKKYRDLSSNKEEMCESMKKKFGLDIIFNGKKDSPYGYMLVDHKNKIVYKGSDVLPIKELLRFSSHAAERTPEKINEFVKAKLAESPDISTFEMSKLLQRKFDAYISTGEEFTSRNEKKSGTIVVNHKNFKLDQELYERLRYNGRMKWLQTFHPSTKTEKQILIKFGHVEEPDKIHVEPNADRLHIDTSLSKIENVITTANGSVFDAFHNNKLILYRQDNSYYILDIENKAIVDLQKEGVDTSMFKKAEYEKHYGHKQGQTIKGSEENRKSQSESPSLHSSVNGQEIRNVLKPTGGHSTNREWEVGNNGRWDDVDDERTLKR